MVYANEAAIAAQAPSGPCPPPLFSVPLRLPAPLACWQKRIMLPSIFRESAWEWTSQTRYFCRQGRRAEQLSGCMEASIPTACASTQQWAVHGWLAGVQILGLPDTGESLFVFFEGGALFFGGVTVLRCAQVQLCGRCALDTTPLCASCKLQRCLPCRSLAGACGGSLGLGRPAL